MTTTTETATKTEKRVHDRRVFLKVKIKSLAAEARIIRAEEGKRKGKDNEEERAGLHEHRVRVVRSEQRHTLLAYGFIRGRALEQIEPKSTTPVDWKKVKGMVERYGAYGAVSGFDRWLGEGR